MTTRCCTNSFQEDQFIERLFGAVLLTQSCDDGYLPKLHQLVSWIRAERSATRPLSMTADVYLSRAVCDQFTTFQSWATFLGSAVFTGLYPQLCPLTVLTFLGELVGHFDSLRLPSDAQRSLFVNITQDLISLITEKSFTSALPVKRYPELSSEAAELACVLSQLDLEGEPGRCLHGASVVLSLVSAALVMRDGRTLDADLADQIRYLLHAPGWKAESILEFVAQVDVLARFAEVLRSLQLFDVEIEVLQYVHKKRSAQYSRHTSKRNRVKPGRSQAQTASRTKESLAQVAPLTIRKVSRSINVKCAPEVDQYISSSQSTAVGDDSDTTELDEEDFFAVPKLQTSRCNRLYRHHDSRSCSPPAAMPPKPAKRRKVESKTRKADPSSDDLDLFMIDTPGPYRRV